MPLLVQFRRKLNLPIDQYPPNRILFLLILLRTGFDGPNDPILHAPLRRDCRETTSSDSKRILSKHCDQTAPETVALMYSVPGWGF